MMCKPSITYKLWLCSIALLCACLLDIKPAQAIEIQRVKSAGGIEAWLVESHSIPLIAVRFAFRGGAGMDPKGKAGLTYLASTLLDEGAGELSAKTFQKKMQSLAMRMSFSATKDWFSGSFQTLSKNKTQSFDLLRKALTTPHFDVEPVERLRSQIAISIKQDAQNPSRQAATAWMKYALKDHVYTRPTKGDISTLKSITRDDLKHFAQQRLVRKGLIVAVVGDIKPEELAKMLDKVFGKLPATGEVKTIRQAVIRNTAAENFIQMNIPQTIIQFGHKGFVRDDKDFIPAYIINYILGGGGFASRLTQEIRVKRGLTYSVYSVLHPLKKAALFLGAASTRSDRAGETIKLIRAELAKMAKLGPTPKELRDAKTYLIGSYALRFDSNAKIAGQLLNMQKDALKIDYVKRRNAIVNAVTIRDVKRVAKRLLRPDGIMFTIVGKTPPQAVKPAKQIKQPG